MIEAIGSTMGTGTTTGTKLIIAGDFRTGDKIVDRLVMSVEILPHMLGSNRLPLGVRGVYAYWRTGAGWSRRMRSGKSRSSRGCGRFSWRRCRAAWS